MSVWSCSLLNLDQSAYFEHTIQFILNTSSLQQCLRYSHEHRNGWNPQKKGASVSISGSVKGWQVYVYMYVLQQVLVQHYMSSALFHPWSLFWKKGQPVKCEFHMYVGCICAMKYNFHLHPIGWACPIRRTWMEAHAIELHNIEWHLQFIPQRSQFPHCQNEVGVHYKIDTKKHMCFKEIGGGFKRVVHFSWPNALIVPPTPTLHLHTNSVVQVQR